jgi:polyisoprenoid-binding protein YceI
MDTIATASIRTNNGMRDNDLRSSKFLEVEKYPVITFKRTSVEPAGTDRYKLTGDLTIKGNTRPVTLDVTRYGEFNDPGMMGHRIAYGATTKINRKEFGLSFNAILDGRLVVSEDIQIMIEDEIVEQPGGRRGRPLGPRAAERVRAFSGGPRRPSNSVKRPHA